MSRDDIHPNRIIQAPPTTIPAEKSTPTRSEVSPAFEEEEEREDCSPHKRANDGDGAASIGPSPTSRHTRSKDAPRWTPREALVLVSEVAIAKGDWQLRSISSFQRWKIISDCCGAAGAVRSSVECRRKWEDLVAEFRRIEGWEAKATKSSSYWRISRDRRNKNKLPVEFDREVFDAMSAAIVAQEHELVDEDGDSEDIVDTPQEPLAIEDGNLGDLANESPVELDVEGYVQETSKSRRRKRISKDHSFAFPGSEEVVQEMARKINERAELVHEILWEGNQFKDAEEAGRKSSLLVKALDGLTEALDMFGDFIKAGDRRQ